jgi:hypothetical protein
LLRDEKPITLLSSIKSATFSSFQYFFLHNFSLVVRREGNVEMSGFEAMGMK